MSTTTDLIRILQGFVQGTRPRLDDESSFDRLYAAAYQQTLLPILSYMDKRWKLFDAAQSARLRSALLQAVCCSTVCAAAFDELSAALSRAGIPHMPVKGWYLRSLYPEPDLRTYGDIDVLLRPEDRAAADSLMRQWGYTVQANWEPTYSYSKQEEYYEFHTSLMDANLDGRSDLELYFSSAWDHAVPVRELCYAPEPDFHFLYILCHLAKHLYGNGAGLRMYLDVALFIRAYNDTLPWEQLRQEMRQLQLETFFDLLLTTAEQWFGVTARTEFSRADTQTMDELAEYTLQGGIFGFGHDTAIIAARRETTSVLRKVFPPRRNLVRRYTYLEKHPWLLPVAWVDRVLRNVGSIKARTRHLRAQANTSADDVKAYDTFMKKLGL